MKEKLKSIEEGHVRPHQTNPRFEWNTLGTKRQRGFRKRSGRTFVSWNKASCAVDRSLVSASNYLLVLESGQSSVEKKRKKDGGKKMDGAQEMESRRKKRLAKNVRMNIWSKRYMQKKEEKSKEEDRVVDSRIPNVSF